MPFRCPDDRKEPDPDPHGDLTEALLALVPRRRIDDVVVFDPSDTKHVVAFNPFYRVMPDDRALVASNLIGTMKHIWADSRGPSLNKLRLAHYIDRPRLNDRSARLPVNRLRVLM